jgi:phage baseplate assembly protein W
MSDPIQSDLTQPHFLAYPYSVSGQGTPNTSSPEDHLRELILQLLFTVPGERVNLPEFGVGVQRLVFEPNSDTLRTSVQFLISTNLQRWLGDRINVEQVSVTSVINEEETVTIEIVYTLNATQQRQSMQVVV